MVIISSREYTGPKKLYGSIVVPKGTAIVESRQEFLRLFRFQEGLELVD